MYEEIFAKAGEKSVLFIKTKSPGKVIPGPLGKLWIP